MTIFFLLLRENRITGSHIHHHGLDVLWMFAVLCSAISTKPNIFVSKFQFFFAFLSFFFYFCWLVVLVGRVHMQNRSTQNCAKHTHNTPAEKKNNEKKIPSKNIPSNMYRVNNCNQCGIGTLCTPKTHIKYTHKMNRIYTNQLD